MTDWPQSATLEAISTPRFIGPGCMTRFVLRQRQPPAAYLPMVAVFSMRGGIASAARRDDLRPHRRQAVDVAARHAGVYHVAADRDLRPPSPPRVLHRQHIQQRLSVLVHAVARVDDARLHVAQPPGVGAPSSGGGDDVTSVPIWSACHAGVDPAFRPWPGARRWRRCSPPRRTSPARRNIRVLVEFS